MAFMAQHEREMIFDAYQGCPAGCQAAGREAWRRAPVVKELQAAGCESLRAIAAGLDEYGIPAARGGKWSSTQVMRLLEAGGPFDGASGRRRMKRKRVK
jgi:Recombinase